MPDGTRVLTTQDILALVQNSSACRTTLGVDVESKDYAAEAAGIRATRSGASSTSTRTSATAGSVPSAS